MNYRFWISNYCSDFKKDEELILLVKEFMEEVECEEEKKIIHLSNM